MQRHAAPPPPSTPSPAGTGQDGTQRDRPGKNQALHIGLIGHGYPPREIAGTEQHMASLARGLIRRGHRVTVIAATRDPAARQYSHRVERGRYGEQVHRIVQNVPARALAQAERDRAVETIINQILRPLAPDLIHIHHVQFLSSGLLFDAPTVLTLHDQWLWCAAGGLGVRQDLPDGCDRSCPGPSPDRCAPCASAWAPRPTPAATLALATAGLAAHWVPPDWLHAAFAHLPSPLRSRLTRPRRSRKVSTGIQSRMQGKIQSNAAARKRNAALAELAGRTRLLIAPSEHLGRLAEAAGVGPVQLLRHGCPPAEQRPVPTQRSGPLLFLGTIAAHKGPDLVVRAWRRAFPSGSPQLALHGPVQDPSLSLGHPIGPVLDRAAVAAALADARVLIVGSTWPENAPLVITEALAAGCPVIAPAAGGIPELITAGRDGWLYRLGDEQALAAAMTQAVDQPLATCPVLPPSPDLQLDLLLGLYQRALADH